MVKLPALDIQNFLARYEEWSSFYDIFMVLIHKNRNLMAIHKLLYLRSVLFEDVKNCTKCLETTAVNYEAAWSSLVICYNNKKILIQTHVKNIIDLSSLKYKSSEKLRKLSETLNSSIKSLEALGESPYN